MKHKLIYCIILLFFFASCSDKDVNKNCIYLPVISDQTEILNAKTHVFFKNFEFPKGVVPVLYTVDSIPQIEVASYADNIFDSIASNSPDQKAFKQRGLLLVVSRHPTLIQARTGSGYSVYCKMKGVTSGFNYVTMQNDIAEKGLNEMCPKFVYKITNEINEYRDLSWIQKIRIRSGLLFISEYLKDAGTPSNSFFDQFYFTPFVKLIALLFKLTQSWFLSFLIITCVIFIIGNIIRRWITKKIGKVEIEDIRAGHFISIIIQYIITIIISFPTIAAITILSNARTEDKLVLESAHIPYLDIINWSTESNNLIPSLGLLVLIGFVFYWRYITKYPGYLPLAMLKSETQKKLYSCSQDIQEECKILLQGGFMRRRLYSIVLSSSHVVDSNILDTDIGPDPNGKEDLITDNMDIQTIFNKLLFHHEKSSFFIREPFHAVVSNRNREAVAYVFILMICSGIIFTKPIVLYLLALWTVSFINRCIIDYKCMSNIKKEIPILNLRIKLFLKKYVFILSAILLLFCGFIELTKPQANPNVLVEVNTNIFNHSMIPGLYNVIEVGGSTPSKVVTARISKDKYSDYYNLKIYSSMPTVLHQIKYDSLSYSFTSETLGNGTIDFDKEINKTTIKFKKGWTLVK